jgi:hypothetical protein
MGEQSLEKDGALQIDCSTAGLSAIRDFRSQSEASPIPPLLPPPARP